MVVDMSLTRPEWLKRTLVSSVERPTRIEKA